MRRYLLPQILKITRLPFKMLAFPYICFSSAGVLYSIAHPHFLSFSKDVWSYKWKSQIAVKFNFNFQIPLRRERTRNLHRHFAIWERYMTDLVVWVVWDFHVNWRRASEVKGS